MREVKPSSTERTGEIIPGDSPSPARDHEATASVAGSAGPAPSPRLAIWFVSLCLLGVAVSIELTRIHLFVHTDPSYHSVCALSEGSTAKPSRFPLFGFRGSPGVGLGPRRLPGHGRFALWGWSRRRLHPGWPWGLLLLLAGFCVGVSVVLAFISATRIDSLCLFCMGSYAINAGLLLVACIAWKRSQARAGTCWVSMPRPCFPVPFLR